MGAGSEAGLGGGSASIGMADHVGNPRVTRGRGTPQRSGPMVKPAKGTATEGEAGSGNGAEADPTEARTEDLAAVAERASTSAAAVKDAASVVATAAEAKQVETAAVEEAALPVGDDEDLPYSASARLGVLRKLFFSPGRTEAYSDAESGARVEREAGRSSYARGSFSPAEPVAEDAPPSPLSVTAQPEFLRPKQGAVPVEKEKEPLRTVPTPPRRDSADDIETLPAWRGQYRRKRPS